MKFSPSLNVCDHDFLTCSPYFQHTNHVMGFLCIFVVQFDRTLYISACKSGFMEREKMKESNIEVKIAQKERINLVVKTPNGEVKILVESFGSKRNPHKWIQIFHLENMSMNFQAFDKSKVEESHTLALHIYPERTSVMV